MPTELIDDRYRAVLEPGRLLRWIYLGRIALATAIFVTALMALFSDPGQTLIATVVFVGAMALTAYSFVRTEVNRKSAGPGFLYLQFVHDLVLITAVVHLTGGSDSPFSALYILVNAVAALLLPIGSSLLLAMLGSVLYAGDAVVVNDGAFTSALVLQLVVFTAAAVGTGYIAARLQEAGAGRERLRAELDSMRLRAADILGTIRAGIITVDSRGRLAYANPAASEILGMALNVRLGAPVLDQIRLSASAVADAIDLHITQGRLTNRSEGWFLRDGRQLPLGITTTAVSGDISQEGRATTVIFQDISDEKRLETLRLRAQRLEAVAELSASLAHEIKNPLASIRSAVEQISRRQAATPDERTLGELIVRESDRLSRLLSEFLDFARVPEAHRERLDLRTLVRGATALAAEHPDRSDSTEIKLDLPSVPVMADGDEDMLHRAVFNLVLNALQASSGDDEVKVSLRTMPASEQPSGLSFDAPAVAIEVSDAGPGVPPAMQDRLFEPFVTSKEGGSGLGLAIVYRAIEAHRGVVLVDSGSWGTRFTVLLPTTESSLETGVNA